MRKDWWRDTTDHLGGIYPYYDINQPKRLTLDFSSLANQMKSNDEKLKIDRVALVTKICLPYLVGDRTLLSDVRRSPWMAHYDGEGSWRHTNIPEHGFEKPDSPTFSKQLKSLLLKEALSYVAGHDTVGILLSGGMDSRVVAGVLRELQRTGNGPKNVVAICWGPDNCRDVVYAKRIAKNFNWDFINLPITHENLASNIEYAAIAGAETSPLHYHAMPEVAELGGIDVIVAGSYGDSVGRAEFSGRHLTKLKPLIPEVLDPFGLVHSEAIAETKSALRNEIEATHQLAGVDSSNIRLREIEQEMHYMRRMLQSCMQTIARKIPLYQMFTAPDVYSEMWKLAPSIRNNEWYSRILKELPGHLYDIPWARTGARYNYPSEVEDSLSNSYHSYGIWLRNELKDSILSKLDSKVIRDLNVFNGSSLDRLINTWQKAGTRSVNQLDETVSWLATLHDFILMYNVSTPEFASDYKFNDTFRGAVGRVRAELYVSIRNRARE